MKQLFQSLSRTYDGAFVIDGRHRIIFWNQEAAELLGYTAEEAIGRPCYEILGGRDERGRTLCQRYCRVAIQAKRGELLSSQEVFVHTKKGEGRWLNVTSFPYPVVAEPTGHVIVHLFRDITEIIDYQRFAHQVINAFERLDLNGGSQNTSPAPTKPQGNELTAREWQVLGLLAQGKGTGEMAVALTISPSTVRNHVQNILDKLGVHSRLEAIAHAYQHGLIESNGR